MKERVLKKGMSIQCRTEEEEQVFREFAHKEGHRWAGGGYSLLKEKNCQAPCSFQIEYAHRKYPNSISHASIDYHLDNAINIEASELFRNQLISRRIKNGIS